MNLIIAMYTPLQVIRYWRMYFFKHPSPCRICNIDTLSGLGNFRLCPRCRLEAK